MRRRPRFRRLLMLAALASLAVAVSFLRAAPAVALPAECSQGGFTVTCTYTSGSNAFAVPHGVSSVHVVAVGGSGGSGIVGNNEPGPSGGAGARVEGDLSVTPGTTIWAVVGGNGQPGGSDTSGGGGANGGANGNGCPQGSGGGGGASDVRTSPADLTTRLLVAAGGGGGGCSRFAQGGDGGAAATPGTSGTDCAPCGADNSNAGGGGGAGGAAAGGAGGAGGAAVSAESPGCTGAPGDLGVGGFGSFAFTPGDCFGGGGGGGAGLYGGGGGGGPSCCGAGAGGGGGGSNLVPAGGSGSTDSTGSPEIVISYAAPDVVTPSSLDFGNQPIGSTSTARTVTLLATGSAPINVGSLSIGGANSGDFAVSADNCSATSVAAGGSCTASVTFAPTATGARSATLSFADDADDSPQTVALSGNGTTLADVAAAISGPSSARSGSQDTYVFALSNAGPSTALNVVMTAHVPSGTKFVSVSTTHGSCSHPASGATSGTITCSLGDLASGSAALNSVSLKVTLNSKGGSVSVAAQAASTANGATPATPDPNLGNNVASLNTTISKK